MIEREQHRADVHSLQASLGTYLKQHHPDLVERIAQTALERGYARYVPELTETLNALVRGLSDAIANFIASGQKSAYHPGDTFDGDRLVTFVREQAETVRGRGVRVEVLFGLLQQCRAAYLGCCGDAELDSREACRALLELCFDRLELGLVEVGSDRFVDCSDGSSTFGRAGEVRAVVDASASSSSAEQEANLRTKQLTVVNEQLRRELDQHRRLEEERELYYRALLNSQKLEAVGSLAGGVAHDLNNLFQVVRCNIDLLRERADSTSYGMLEEVGQVTDRAVALVRQLLLFSRKQPMARRVLDIGEVVRDLLRLLRRVMPENVHLFSEVEDQLPLVRADLSAIEQLVMNLIINARDSMPRGGTIHVSVCRRRRVPPERIRAAPSLQQVAIYVRDVGVGMSQDVLARIFDPFFTTKTHSSGLGLSVVHGIVEEHGGWVEVTSSMGQGTSFAVFLPAAEDAISAEAGLEATEQAVTSSHTAHVLLVEDEEVVRRALGRELSRYGYSVQAVASAEEAMAVYRRAPGHFDCVISDGLMPGMSGPEMVLEMLKENAQQRAIFISGYAPTMDCWPELQRRGFPLLAKPFGTKELVSLLEDSLGKEEREPAATVREAELPNRE